MQLNLELSQARHEPFALQLLRLTITDTISTTKTLIRFKKLVLVNILTVHRINESFNITRHLKINVFA
jgi:hypothetical protein